MKVKCLLDSTFSIKKGIKKVKKPFGVAMTSLLFVLGLQHASKKEIIVKSCPMWGSKFTHVFRKNPHLKYCGKLLNCEYL